jgi:hypothetical protein
MKHKAYSDLIITDDYSIFDFISHGQNGKINKRIAFTRTKMEQVYNLAFGDLTEDGEIDDLIISDNGDRNKVLATVVKVVNDYTRKYPYRLIFFRGSTHERTMLYRMAVGLNLEELSVHFDIYAMHFLLKEKTLNFYIYE